MAISKILWVSNLAHGFCSTSFVSNLFRFLKSASRFSGKVLASKRFRLAKCAFLACVLFRSNQVSEISFKVFSQSFCNISSGFFVRLIFFWQRNFLARSFFQHWFRQVLALAFFQVMFIFNSKVGLVKNCRACKIKSLKGWVLVFRRRLFLAPVLANKACTRRWGVWRDSKHFSTPQHFFSWTASPSPPQRG